MNGKLYNAMDWARIEGLVYSEEDNPHDLGRPSGPLSVMTSPLMILASIYVPEQTTAAFT